MPTDPAKLKEELQKRELSLAGRFCAGGTQGCSHACRRMKPALKVAQAAGSSAG